MLKLFKTKNFKKFLISIYKYIYIKNNNFEKYCFEKKAFISRVLRQFSKSM